MTAYASVEAETARGSLSFELRSVNHRWLELGLRLPDELRALEPALRERVSSRLGRGKVDLSLRWKPRADASAITLDAGLTARLAETAHLLAAKFPVLQVDFTSLLGWPGLLLEEPLDRQGLSEAALDLLDRGLDELIATREREGARLGAFLGERLDAIERIIGAVRAHLPALRQALRARLDARLAELRQPLDAGRLEQEIVLQLQRLDVDEELDRLDAHIAEARRIAGLAEPIGRRLDFLMQEFNREANTLGSKAADTETTSAAVELKVLIEQMREQVQNIE